MDNNSALRGLRQFRLLDWMLLIIFSAQAIQVWHFLDRMAGTRVGGGYTLEARPHVAAALLISAVLAGAIVGGALALLGGWRQRVLRGCLIGAILVITLPWLSLMSLYNQ